MRVLTIVTIFAITTTTAAFAKEKIHIPKKRTARAIASNEDFELLHLAVSFGDRQTDFHLKRDQDGNNILQMASYPNVRREVAISVKDTEYLLSKFAALPVDVDSSGSCPRRTITAEKFSNSIGKKNRVAGCLGSGSLESKGLLSLANLLSALF